MSKCRIVLAAVPEQVNIPILLCLERGLFAAHGIQVELRVVPEGTGKMLDLLESGEVDVAFTVTDALFAGKANGRKVRLVGTFVDSPLVWAVACSGRSAQAGALKTLTDLSQSALKRKCRFGISRLGSGSHTMATYARRHYIEVAGGEDGEGESRQEGDGAAVEFVVANNFQGLREGAHNGDFDVFMWETFTTKPFFDSSELRKVGEVPTPWSAFSICCSSSKSSSAETAELDILLKDSLFPALQAGVEAFVNIDEREAMVDRICRDHGHLREDAENWLASCKYAIRAGKCPFSADNDVTERAIKILKQIGLVSADYAVESLLI